MSTSTVAGTESKPPKKKLLKWLLIGGGVLFFIVGAVIAGLLFHYDDAWFKAQIQAELKAQLDRDVEIGSVHVSFLGGSIEINDLTVLNNAAIFSEKHTLKAGRAYAKISVLPVVFSSGKKIQGLAVTLERPEFIIEHRGIWPMEKSNIDDLIKKFTSGPPGVWPKNTGLQALDYSVAVREGTFRYRDSDKNLGESRIQKFELNAKQEALGQPVQFTSKLELLTPASDKSGSADIEGLMDWIDANGSIDPKAFKNCALNVKLNELDVPYVLRHLHIQGNLADGMYQWAPGKPYTGSFKVEAPTLAAVRATANIETNGALSIIQQGKRIAGDIPGQFEFDLQGGWKNGAFQSGPSRFSTMLAASRQGLSDSAAPKLLDLKINAGADEGDARKFIATFNAKLTDLFATDVGQVLNLKDQLGGDLEGRIAATLDQKGQFSSEGKVNTKNGYVAYQGVRQPSSMDMDFKADLIPNSDGTPERAEVKFTAVADSFKIETLQPLFINAINNPQKLAARAKLRLKVGGREFWKQFGPLLKVMSLSTPLEEAMDGELTLSGNAGSVALQLDGTLERQAEPHEPVRVNLNASYDGEALAAAEAKPFLTYSGIIRSADKGINLAFNGSGHRDKNLQIIELKEFKNTSDLVAISKLNARFGAYVSVFPGPDYSVAGYINQTGSSKLVQTLAADGKVLSTDLTMATDLQIPELAIDGKHPVRPGAPPLSLRDKAIKLNLGLALKQNGPNGTLALKPMKFSSENMALEGELDEADLVKLKAAFDANTTAHANTLLAWISALPAAKVDTQINAIAIKQLQANEIIPKEPLIAGELALKAQFDPKTTKGTISRIEINSPLMKMKGSSDEFSVPDLVTLLTAPGNLTGKVVQAIPTLALSLNSKPGFGERLTALGYATAPWPLQGELNVSVNYDAATHLLRVSEIEFSGDAGKYAFKAPSVDLNKAAAILDLKPEQRDLAAMSGMLSDFAIDISARPPMFASLREKIPELRDPLVNGDLILKATYTAAQDQLQVESLKFTRADKSNLPVTQLELAGTAALKQMLPKLSEKTLDVAELLGSFPQGLTLKNLEIKPTDLSLYLLRKKIGGTFGTDMLEGVYAFSSPLTIQNGIVKRGPAAGAIDISFNAKTPMEWHPRPAPSKDPAKASSLTLGGAWGFAPDAPLRVTLANGQTSVQGRVMLDDAAIHCSAAEPAFTYNKAAAAQCRIAFSLTQGADGMLRVPALELSGGPLGFALENLTFNTAAAQPLLTLEKVTLKEGPMAGVISAVSVDMAKDHLRAQAAVDSLDLAKFISPNQFPPSFQLSGGLSGIALSYDGRISAFDTGFTAADKLGARVARADVRATGTSAGKTATLTLAGDLGADWLSVEGKSLGLSLGEQKMQLALKAVPRVAGDDLLKALKKPGLPLAVNLTCDAAAPFNVKALTDALDTLLASMTTPGAKSSGGMDGIKNLQVTVSLNAPLIVAGGQNIQNFQMPSMVLSDLNVNIPDAHGTVLQDGTFALANSKLNLETQKFSGDLNYKNLDLHTLLTPGKPKKDEYEILGRAGGSCQITGTGFSDLTKTVDMKGTVVLSNLIAQKNDGKASTDVTKSLIGVAGAFGGSYLSGFGGEELMLITTLYSDDFGLFLNKMEFEEIRAPITLSKGLLNIADTSLVGKGRSAGLQIDLAGAMDLATERFKPNLTLYLVKLTPKTQDVLRLNQIDPPDKQAILDKFASRKFQPVVLSGALAAPDKNLLELARAFRELNNTVESKIQAKKTGQPQANTTAQPGETKSNPPPKEQKKAGVEDLIDLFKKKKD